MYFKMCESCCLTSLVGCLVRRSARWPNLQMDGTSCGTCWMEWTFEIAVMGKDGLDNAGNASN